MCVLRTFLVASNFSAPELHTCDAVWEGVSERCNGVLIHPTPPQYMEEVMRGGEEVSHLWPSRLCLGESHTPPVPAGLLGYLLAHSLFTFLEAL